MRIAALVLFTACFTATATAGPEIGPRFRPGVITLEDGRTIRGALRAERGSIVIKRGSMEFTIPAREATRITWSKPAPKSVTDETARSSEPAAAVAPEDPAPLAEAVRDPSERYLGRWRVDIDATLKAAEAAGASSKRLAQLEARLRGPDKPLQMEIEPDSVEFRRGRSGRTLKTRVASANGQEVVLSTRRGELILTWPEVDDALVDPLRLRVRDTYNRAQDDYLWLPITPQARQALRLAGFVAQAKARAAGGDLDAALARLARLERTTGRLSGEAAALQQRWSEGKAAQAEAEARAAGDAQEVARRAQRNRVQAQAKASGALTPDPKPVAYRTRKPRRGTPQARVLELLLLRGKGRTKQAGELVSATCAGWKRALHVKPLPSRVRLETLQLQLREVNDRGVKVSASYNLEDGLYQSGAWTLVHEDGGWKVR
jgi:hypothetical protein